jgi:hypothetical protein
VLALTVGTQCPAQVHTGAQERAERESERVDAPRGSERGNASPAERGLRSRTADACPGYTLFAPMNATTTYLVDLDGNVIHRWASNYEPGMAAYLLPDGSLLRAAREPSASFFGGGIGGRIQRIARNGTVVWDFEYSDESKCQHHDIKPLANGNVLLVAWERKTREEAVAAGRNPDRMFEKEMWPDCVVEIEPQGATGGRVVWEWRVWDHLVQDVDAGLPNYGVVAEHPERVDVNFERSQPRESAAEMRRLRALGYVGGAVPEEERGPGQRPSRGPGRFPGGPGGPPGDWCHVNSVDHNERLDQIVLSVHTFNEIWVIDHSTTTEEAASSRGGRSGKGGDLLYRWGNPQAYGAGDGSAQQLFAQHDARWIPDGLPGAGNITVFNNGPGRADGQYSSVIEIAPPIEATGGYARERGRAFGPAGPAWEYKGRAGEAFFSGHISGAQRLSNGNTLICSGEQGRIFEVSRMGQIAWDYWNPFIQQDRKHGPRPRFDAQSTTRPAPGGPGQPRRSGPGGARAWGGMWWPPGPPPGMGPPEGGLFRATRVQAGDPGVQALLEAKAEANVTE